MGFVARKDDEVIEWGREKYHDGEIELCTGGIRKGDEVLNHYCDVQLPVQERREVRLSTTFAPSLALAKLSLHCADESDG